MAIFEDTFTSATLDVSEWTLTGLAPFFDDANDRVDLTTTEVIPGSQAYQRGILVWNRTMSRDAASWSLEFEFSKSAPNGDGIFAWFYCEKTSWNVYGRGLGYAVRITDSTVFFGKDNPTTAANAQSSNDPIIVNISSASVPDIDTSGGINTVLIQYDGAEINVTINGTLRLTTQISIQQIRNHFAIACSNQLEVRYSVHRVTYDPGVALSAPYDGVKLVGYTSATTQGATPTGRLECPVPEGTAEGDRLVWCGFTDATGQTAVSGMTERYHDLIDPDLNSTLMVYDTIASASEPASYFSDISGNQNGTAFLVALRASAVDFKSIITGGRPFTRGTAWAVDHALVGDAILHFSVTGNHHLVVKEYGLMVGEISNSDFSTPRREYLTAVLAFPARSGVQYGIFPGPDATLPFTASLVYGAP